MKILFLESFYGGSHKDFADGAVSLSGHGITLLTLPARHWKWRQGGSALAFLRLMEERDLTFDDFDALIVTGLTDLNLLKSLKPLPPVLLYLHETQFHYPLGPGEKEDFHYGLKDFTNMLAADKVIFNSRYHGETFFDQARRFLKRMPDFKPLDYLDALEENWEVVYPGFTLPTPTNAGRELRRRGEAPVLLWNHRWEHDKNPDDFYHFLGELKKRDFPFKLILLGERFSRYPEVFDRIMDEFAREIISSNYAESREEYAGLLEKSDYVISTSGQENFGISIVEAVGSGAVPLLPRRLSYPEILDNDFHSLMYDNREKLLELLVNLEENPLPNPSRKRLLESMVRFDRQMQISRMDTIITDMCKRMERNG